MIRSLLLMPTLLVCLALLLSSASVLADVLTIRDNAPQQYIVKKGDTLWDISETFLNKPWRWPELWRKNDYINNPHLIYPGDVLHLLYDAQGQPYLAVGKRKVTLSPHGQVSLKDLTLSQLAIPTYSLQMLAPYLTDYYVVGTDEMQKLQDAAAKVMGMQTGFDRGTFAHTAYVMGDVSKHQQLAVIHVGQPINQFDTDETVGFEIFVAGLGEIKQLPSQNSPLSSLRISTVKREVLQGDLVVPLSLLSGFSNLYQLQASTAVIDAHIISSASQGVEIGKYDIVVIDAGRQDGLKNGDVLSVTRSSPIMTDSTPPSYVQQLPARDTSLGQWFNGLFSGDSYSNVISLGEILVLQTKPNLSLALVLNTRTPLRAGDSVTASQ